MKHSWYSILFLLLATGPALRAGDSPYFVRIYEQISDNIDEDRLEANLALLPVITQDTAFQSLSCYDRGRIFHKIGVTYYLLDREEEAIRLYRDSALTVWSDCAEVSATERANTIYNIGICYQYLGQESEAKRYLDEALYIFESNNDYPPVDLAKKFQGIANFYRDNYDSFRAELYYENALNLLRQIEGTALRRFDILNNFLILSLDFKKYEAAEGYFEEAMGLYRADPQAFEDYELSILYQNMGIAHFELGQMEAAMEKSRKGLNLIDSIAYPLLYSNAIEKIAAINGEQGRYEQAIAALQQVIRLRKQHLSNSETQRFLAYAYENLHEIYKKQGDWNCAEEYLNKALDVLMPRRVNDEAGTPVVSQSVAIDNMDLVRLLSLRADLYDTAAAGPGRREVLERKLHIHMKIDTLISRHLLSMQFEGSKLNFLELIQGYYGQAIRDALQLHRLSGLNNYLERAYFFSSKTKAIILQNELNEADAFRSVASTEMIRQEQALTRRMFDLRQKLTEGNGDRDSLLRAYTEAQRTLEVFLQRVEAEAPDYYKNKYAFITPPDLQEIRQALPAGLAVVEYFYQPDTIYSFWITRDQFFEHPLVNDELMRENLRKFVDRCRDPSLPTPYELGHVLYHELLRAGLDRLGSAVNRLCIIPDGALHTLPFEALNPRIGKQDSYLIEAYSLAYSYSIGLLFRDRARSFEIPYLGFGARYSPELTTKLRNRRLLFGNESLDQLHFSAEEIARGNEIFNGKVFLETDASLENFYAYSSQARIIHLSLHGLVDFEDPLRSCVVFDDHREPFILSAADLYAHRINADLVILSACHSADGKIYLGEGVQGMSKAFVLSGAKTILSSLWNASEVSSLQLMPTFLQYVAGGAANDLALHRAKLDYLDRARPSQRHPFYWANFVMIGEIDKGGGHGWPRGLLIALVAGFLTLVTFLKFRSRTANSTEKR